MKMPEKHDLLFAIHDKEQEHRGNPCVLQWRSRGRYNGGAFYKNSNRRTSDVRHYRA